jgi:hypothetical protein
VFGPAVLWCVRSLELCASPFLTHLH